MIRVATLLSETRLRGKDLASVTICHRRLIKAQAAASVGLTGLSLDREEEGAGRSVPAARKRGVCGKEKGRLRAPPCFAHAQLS